MKSIIFGVLIVLLLGIIAFFTATEVRLCESTGYPHAEHQLSNFYGDTDITHRYIK